MVRGVANEAICLNQNVVDVGVRLVTSVNLGLIRISVLDMDFLLHSE